jgi:ABC-type branched-subunit amino acid transport system substrate-binding protein
MRRLAVALRLALALLSASATTACGPSRTLDPSVTAPVRVGLIVPLMGESGASGGSWRDAVRLAVREVNSAGGALPGRNVQLFVEDSRSTAPGAVAAYQALETQEVVAIVGEASSTPTIAVLMEIQDSTRPVLLGSPSATSTLLTQMNMGPPGDRWFFRAIPSDAFQAPALADAMYADGCRNIAILHVNDDYGTPFESALRTQFLTQPLAMVRLSQPFMDGRADYTTEVMAVAAAAPDCIALIAFPQSGGTIVRNWSTMPMPPVVRWYGTDGIRERGFVDEAGDPMRVDGFRGTAPLTEFATPAYNRFRDNFEAMFGTTPAAFGSHHYDAAALILLAIAAAGTDDPVAIRDALRSLNTSTGVTVQAGNLGEGIRALRAGQQINYDGASGPVDVDQYGDVTGAFELWEFDSALGPAGEFTQVRPL